MKAGNAIAAALTLSLAALAVVIAVKGAVLAPAGFLAFSLLVTSAYVTGFTWLKNGGRRSLGRGALYLVVLSLLALAVVALH